MRDILSQDEIDALLGPTLVDDEARKEVHVDFKSQAYEHQHFPFRVRDEDCIYIFADDIPIRVRKSAIHPLY